ncbi:MAG: hypothetical protein IT444_04610 [Phycisphaeraceae bacterium]|nr:hypothetical protein [Phycisphaeraceae bacterium]
MNIHLRFPALLLILGMLASAADAQTTRPADSASSGLVTFNLMDGSIISGTLGVKEIPIDTDFGALVVPVSKIISVTPGLDSHTDFQANFAKLVEKLGSQEVTERDAAQKALIRMGPSLRNELVRYQATADPERKLRINAILEEFNDDVSVDEDEPQPAAVIRLDMIQTADFTIVGRIVPKSFAVTSNYGQLTVKLSDIRNASRNISKGVEEINKSLSVDGSNLVQLRFKESGIKVSKGDRITVKADGTLVMTPWGSDAQSTPDGAPNYGWYIQNQIPMGMLIAKIGKSGSVFKVGSNNTFTAEQSGELQFAIAMHQGYASNSFPGKYNVKIKVRPKSTNP